MGILPYDTRDETGAERYMTYQPGFYLTNKPQINNWYYGAKRGMDAHWGADFCAAKSASFHYIDMQLMRRIHAILYQYC